MTTSTSELWDNRGRIFAAALVEHRTAPQTIDWTSQALAESLPADRKAELVRELRSTKAARTVTVEAVAAKAKAAVESAHKRRAVAESADEDCVCVAIGHGGTCTVCG